MDQIKNFISKAVAWLTELDIAWIVIALLIGIAFVLNLAWAGLLPAVLAIGFAVVAGMMLRDKLKEQATAPPEEEKQG